MNSNIILDCSSGKICTMIRQYLGILHMYILQIQLLDVVVGRHWSLEDEAVTFTTESKSIRQKIHFHHGVQIHQVENSLSPWSPNPSGRKFYYIVTKPIFFSIFILVGLLFVGFIIVVQRICLLEFQQSSFPWKQNVSMLSLNPGF